MQDYILYISKAIAEAEHILTGPNYIELISYGEGLILQLLRLTFSLAYICSITYMTCSPR